MDATIDIDETVLPQESQYRPSKRGILNLNIGLVIALGLIGGTVGYLGNVIPGARRYTDWSLWGLLLIYFAYILYRARKARAWVTANYEAASLLKSGEIATAANIYEELCHKASHSLFKHLHATFVYNRALAYMLGGDIDRAISLITAVLKSRWFESQRYGLIHYFPEVLESLARCYAIKGSMDKAEVIQSKAHDLIAPPREGRLLLLDMIIACRRNRFDAAVHDADARWISAEGSLTPADMKSVRMLRAFAIHMKNGTAIDVEIKAALEGIRPFRPGQFDYLSCEWRELNDFLRTWGLTAENSSTPNEPMRA